MVDDVGEFDDVTLDLDEAIGGAYIDIATTSPPRVWVLAMLAMLALVAVVVVFAGGGSADPPSLTATEVDTSVPQSQYQRLVEENLQLRADNADLREQVDLRVEMEEILSAEISALLADVDRLEEVIGRVESFGGDPEGEPSEVSRRPPPAPPAPPAPPPCAHWTPADGCNIDVSSDLDYRSGSCNVHPDGDIVCSLSDGTYLCRGAATPRCGSSGFFKVVGGCQTYYNGDQECA